PLTLVNCRGRDDGEAFPSSTDTLGAEGPTYVCGRYNVNELPLPGALRNWISPPNKLASSLLIARPKPVPPYLRLLPSSACWKASKMIRCLSCGIPIPVSATTNATTEAA